MNPRTAGHLVILLLVVVAARANQRSVSRGTLIVVMPTLNGVIVASDSRSRIPFGNNILTCDDTRKLFPLKRHRAIVAVTGNAEINAPVSSDLRKCEDVKPKIKFGELVQKYLDAQSGEITKNVFESAQKPIIEFFSKAHGNFIIAKPDRVFVEVVFTEFIPENETIVEASFGLCLENRHVTPICQSYWETVKQNDQSGFKVSGDGDCFELARTTEGRQMIGPDYLKDVDALMRDGSLVSGVSHSRALSIVMDVLQTTEKYSEMSGCASNSVGGPAWAYLIDTAHDHPFLLLPFKPK